MGTPSKEEMLAMNPFHEDISMPQMKSTPWSSVFKSNVSPDAISLVSKLLVYDPKKRIGAIDACIHPFFNELKNPATKLPGGGNIPQAMFIFTPEELSLGNPETKDILSSLCNGK
jgi:glycogen synthase kinase 3 beta